MSLAISDYDTGEKILHQVVEQHERAFLPHFIRAMVQRCILIQAIGVSEQTGIRINDALKWIIESVDAGKAVPILLQYAKKFLTEADKHLDKLTQAGLDHDLYDRVVTHLMKDTQ